MSTNEHPIAGLMGTTMEKIRQMIDVNTIIGEPVTAPGGVTIIPISKVSFGFASGGSDFPSKQEKDLFGGGSGAGVSINPIAFLVVSETGDVRLLQLSTSTNTAEKAINLVPDMFDKISAMFKNKGKDKKDSENETL